MRIVLLNINKYESDYDPFYWGDTLDHIKYPHWSFNSNYQAFVSSIEIDGNEILRMFSIMTYSFCCTENNTFFKI